MKKYSIITACILIFSGAIFYLLQTEISTKKKSEDLKSKFNEIDKSLYTSNDSTNIRMVLAQLRKFIPFHL